MGRAPVLHAAFCLVPTSSHAISGEAQATTRSSHLLHLSLNIPSEAVAGQSIFNTLGNRGSTYLSYSSLNAKKLILANLNVACCDRGIPGVLEEYQRAKGTAHLDAEKTFLDKDSPSPRPNTRKLQSSSVSITNRLVVGIDWMCPKFYCRSLL
ncbi:hypothetical protein B0H15DRAFT_854526 [Mycena belliarum]|uniref:Uncharacterized protein n=1 Tax=Mycena belliarum TaxID=1033014 RepID=A0AAD6XKN4_9AGAR|nr:hypothetical protein B0H15DRAFT_854526 [Mycena belliae]